MLSEIVLSGSARERGRCHGQHLRQRIHAHVAKWLSALEAHGLTDPRAYVADFLRNTDFVTETARVIPEALEEIKGISEGAGLEADLTFGLQLIDEEWAYRKRHLAVCSPLEKCSSVSIVDSAGTWIGQNMDLGSYTEGQQTLLRVSGQPQQPTALVFSLAGMLALMGVNAAGVAICVNSIPQLPSAPTGLPVAMVIRRLLMETSAARAAELVLSISHATNQHYLIADRNEAHSLEASSSGVVNVSTPWEGRFFHTNHPLAAAWAASAEPFPEDEHSMARLKSLITHLSKAPIDLPRLQAALSAQDDPRHPVCRVQAQEDGLTNFTTGSMISYLGRTETVRTWISEGPPCLNGYSKYRF